MKHTLTLLAALLLVLESRGQDTGGGAPSPAVPSELGAPPERVPQAPGQFYELPPRWGHETVDQGPRHLAGLLDAGYIKPGEVARNYHYEQQYRPQFHFTALHGHIGTLPDCSPTKDDIICSSCSIHGNALAGGTRRGDTRSAMICCIGNNVPRSQIQLLTVVPGAAAALSTGITAADCERVPKDLC